MEKGGTHFKHDGYKTFKTLVSLDGECCYF